MNSKLCAVEWDKDHEVMYVRLTDDTRDRRGIVKRSVRDPKYVSLVLDYDAEGKLVGIEIIDVRERLDGFIA